MPSINLLPTDVVRNREAAKLTQVLRVAAVGLGVLTLGLGFAIGGYFLYKDQNLKKIQAEYDTYKSQVLALESTENSLILVRDRLEKIASIQTKYPYNKGILATDALLRTLPDGVSLSQISGAADIQKITFIAKDSGALRALLELIDQNQSFKKVTFRSSDYNPAAGYQVIIEISNI